MLMLLYPFTVLAVMSESSGVLEHSGEFISVNVDRVEVDTAGLADASTALAASIDGLALSISRLSEGGADLSDAEKQILLDAVQSAQKASDALAGLAQQLPQATRNATQLVKSTLDAALQRLLLYAILLVVIVALALVGIMWFVYRQYLRPLTLKLDELVGAPEQFENTARHMKETAAILQALQVDSGRIAISKVTCFPPATSKSPVH